MTTPNSVRIVKKWIEQIKDDNTEETRQKAAQQYTQLAEIELDNLMIKEATQEAARWKDRFHRLKRSVTCDRMENFELKQEVIRLTQELQKTIEMKEKTEKRIRKVTRNFSTPRTCKGRHY